ncbi:MAG: ATP synthase F1 subunit gamma [Actinobacteria bacterium]|nr:ATP synthase F1 subunit gamma [Actinomycetota bacterium]
MAGKGKREISRRIKAVKNIQQITKAMKMVAAAKLRRAQEKVISARPYAKQLTAVLERLVASEIKIQHPLTEVREVRRAAYVVVTGDRGLCGSYNINVIRRAGAAFRDARAEAALVPIGRKGRDFFRRRGRASLVEFLNIGEEPSFGKAREIAHNLMSLFLGGEVDEVRLIYSEFISALQQKPVEVRLLPIVTPTRDERAPKGPPVEYIFEPSPEDVLNTLLPKFVEVQVYRTLLEAKASEQGARMTAMGSATDNAAEMIQKLTLIFNQARQAGITREITEIVSGADALH